MGGGLLGWRRNLHPIILPPLHRDPVLCRLARDNWGLNPFYIFLFLLHRLSLLNLSHLFHKLVLQGLKAVETDGGHVPVLHRDRSLRGLVLPQEGEVLKMGNMQQENLTLVKSKVRIRYWPLFLRKMGQLQKCLLSFEKRCFLVQETRAIMLQHRSDQLSMVGYLVQVLSRF